MLSENTVVYTAGPEEDTCIHTRVCTLTPATTSAKIEHVDVRRDFAEIVQTCSALLFAFLKYRVP